MISIGIITSYHYTMLYNTHSGEITRTNGQKSFLDDFPVVDYKVDTGMKIMPLSLIFVGMITFNNLCLQYVQVSFYNVARCLSLVFNVMFSYFLLGQTTSYLTCSTLLVVIAGFICGIQGEIDFSLLGIIYVLSLYVMWINHHDKTCVENHRLSSGWMDD